MTDQYWHLVGRVVRHSWSWKAWDEVFPAVRITDYRIVEVDGTHYREPMLFLRGVKDQMKTRMIPAASLGGSGNHFLMGLQERYTLRPVPLWKRVRAAIAAWNLRAPHTP